MPINFWDEWSPEGVISGIYTEVYQDVIAIAGYSSLLLRADPSPEEKLQFAESLLAHVEYIKSVFESIHHYSLNRLSAKTIYPHSLDYPEEAVMRKGQCPKCGSRNVFTKANGIGTGDGLYVRTDFMVAPSPISDYICTDCGYFERYVEDKKKLDEVAQKWQKGLSVAERQIWQQE